MKLVVQGQEFDVQPGADSVTVAGSLYSVRIDRRGEIATVYVNERPYYIQLPPSREGPVKLLVDAKEYKVELKGGAPSARPARPAAARRPAPPGGAGVISAQMTGRVVRVNVQPGDAVKEGDILLVVEAMKMENEILAPKAGTVKEVAVTAGARVSEGDLLVILELEG